jgi:hypothetical protein
VNAIPTNDFEICLSVGLYWDWQEVLTRPENLPPGLTVDDARGFLRYLANQAHLQEIHFLWRPFLPDADDNLVLEAAFAGECPYIITHNVKDFRGSEELGVAAISPRDFMSLIRKKL